VLVVIPFMFYEAFVDKPEQQYPWVRDAVSRPYIKSTGDSLRIILQRLVPSSLMGPEQQQGLLLQQDNSSVARAGGKRVRVVLYRGGPARTNTEPDGGAGVALLLGRSKRPPWTLHATTVRRGLRRGAGLAEDDRLREECGVFGVFGNEDAAALTALGLHALQHRGQEAAGIVTYDGQHFHSERRLGLVGDNFNKVDVIGRLRGHIALGHVRYSTTGDTILRNVQPLFADLDTGGIALAHNGNLTNALTLRRDLISSGAICQSTSDSEVILHLMARSQRRRTVERFVEALRQIQGAYALVCLTNDMLIGAATPSASGRWCWDAWTVPTCWHRRPARSTSSAPSSCARSRTARS
jgi:predicted glutamine amidotransferase